MLCVQSSICECTNWLCASKIHPLVEEFHWAPLVGGWLWRSIGHRICQFQLLLLTGRPGRNLPFARHPWETQLWTVLFCTGSETGPKNDGHLVNEFHWPIWKSGSWKSSDMLKNLETERIHKLAQSAEFSWSEKSPGRKKHWDRNRLRKQMAEHVFCKIPTTWPMFFVKSQSWRNAVLQNSKTQLLQCRR